MTPRGLQHRACTCHDRVCGFLCQWHIFLLLHSTYTSFSNTEILQLSAHWGFFNAFAFSSLDIHVVFIGVLLTLRQSWVAQYGKAEMLAVPTVGEESHQLPVQRQRQDKSVAVSKNIQLHPFYLEQTATGQHVPTQDHGVRHRRLFPLYFLVLLTNFFIDCTINLGIIQFHALLCPLALPKSGIDVQLNSICFEMSSFN